MGTASKRNAFSAVNPYLPMDAEKLRALILVRLDRYQSWGCTWELNQADTEIRLLSTLLTGTPISLHAGTAEICEHCGIPHGYNKDGTINHKTEWLKAHGFVIDAEKNAFHHSDPEFGNWEAW